MSDVGRFGSGTCPTPFAAGAALPSPLKGRGSLADSAALLAGMAGALLGWRPAEFWAATPAELAAVLLALGGEGSGLASDELARLMEAFPDG